MKKLKVTVDGKVYEVDVEILDDGGQPAYVPPARSASSSSAAAAPAPTTSAPKPVAGDGEVPSPLSAVVVSIDVNEGDSVEEGDKLITLEAMKMNTLVTAPVAGTIGEILVAPGDAVEEGQGLLKIS